MVKLNRIYTKTGDAGTTGLGSGQRVSKADLRVEAYGTVDEANACIGVAITHCTTTTPGSLDRQIQDLLLSIQHDLFDLGADLCIPIKPKEDQSKKLRILPAQVERLERAIDHYNDKLSELKSFVLPGGTALAAALHVARTVVRRAERLCVLLTEKETAETSPEAVKYLNRLSDLLFVLGRVANDWGKTDVLWAPGQNRPHA